MRESRGTLAPSRTSPATETMARAHIFHLESLNIIERLDAGAAFVRLSGAALERVFNTPTFPRNEPVSDTMLQQPVCTQAAPVGRSVNNCGSMHASRSFPHNYERASMRIRIQGVRREIRNDRFVG